MGTDSNGTESPKQTVDQDNPMCSVCARLNRAVEATYVMVGTTISPWYLCDEHNLTVSRSMVHTASPLWLRSSIKEVNPRKGAKHWRKNRK